MLSEITGELASGIARKSNTSYWPEQNDINRIVFYRLSTIYLK